MVGQQEGAAGAPEPVQNLTLEGWHAAGQRVQTTFFDSSLSDSAARTEYVSCHLLLDLLGTPEAQHRFGRAPSLPPEQDQDRSSKRDSSRHASCALPDEALANEPECVTFLHGYPTSSYDFYPMVRQLLSDRHLSCKLLLIDMLGYGDSDKGVGEARFSIQEHANVVQCVWQRYDIKRSHLVVHDFAVSVAQELLSREPKGRLSIRLEKIFWLNGSVFIDLYRATALQRMLAGTTGWLTARLLTQSTFSASVKQLFSKDHPPSEQVLEGIFKGMNNRGGDKIHHKLVKFMKDRMRYKHVWQGALELAMRTSRPGRMLFFWGMQDPMSGAQIAAELHRRYDQYGLRLTECADLGHWPHLEDPERVARALTTFLLEEYTPAPGAWQSAYRALVGQDSAHRVTVCRGAVQSQGFVPSSFRRKSNSIDRSRNNSSSNVAAGAGVAAGAAGVPGAGNGVAMRRHSSSAGVGLVGAGDTLLGAIQESASEAHPHHPGGGEEGEAGTAAGGGGASHTQKGTGEGGTAGGTAGAGLGLTSHQLHVPDGASSSGGGAAESGAVSSELTPPPEGKTAQQP